MISATVKELTDAERDELRECGCSQCCWWLVVDEHLYGGDVHGLLLDLVKEET